MPVMSDSWNASVPMTCVATCPVMTATPWASMDCTSACAPLILMRSPPGGSFGCAAAHPCVRGPASSDDRPLVGRGHHGRVADEVAGRDVGRLGRPGGAPPLELGVVDEQRQRAPVDVDRDAVALVDEGDGASFRGFR